MFEIGGTELLLIAVVALLVIGPKELPNALRTVGRYTGKARAMTRHLRSGFDEMMRQAELEEMEKQWAEHNRKIMAETPAMPDHAAPPGDPDAPPPADPAAAPLPAAPPEPMPEPEPRPLP
jgi:sec-independent protein translocase protein TatB